MDIQALKNAVRIINDFPKTGIAFLDITTVLQSAVFFKQSIDGLAKIVADLKIDKIMGTEARGFIFASALAFSLDKGLIIARKPGKLPGNTISQSYGLEYGKDTLEIHADSILPGENILIIDDVLATGGTAAAAIELVKALGGNVAGLAFFAEVIELNGRIKLNHPIINSLLHF